MLRKGFVVLAGLFVVGAVAISLPNAANAQQPTPGKEKSAKPNKARGVDALLKKMTDELTLTKDQQAKIRPVLEDMMEKVRSLRKDRAEDPAATRDKMKALRVETRTKVEAFLTPDQKKKFGESNLIGKAPNPKAKTRKGKGATPPPGAAG